MATERLGENAKSKAYNWVPLGAYEFVSRKDAKLAKNI